MRIDSTQLQCYAYCPRAYRNKFVLGLSKIEEVDRLDLNYGICLHKCQEDFYLKDPTPIEKRWEGFINQEGEDYKTKENGIKQCRDYRTHYIEEDRDIKVLAVEKVIEIPLSKELNYLVKLDTTIEKMGNNYSLENKSTKKISPFFFHKFSPNFQISAQTLAVQTAFGQCSGVIVNALGGKMTSEKRPEKLLPEDPAIKDFDHVDIAYSKYYKKEMASCWGYTTLFQRQIINRTPEQLEDFKGQAIMWSQRIKASIANDIFLKNEGFCSYFTTNDKKRECEFKQMCESCDDPQIIEQLYSKSDTKEYLK